MKFYNKLKLGFVEGTKFYTQLDQIIYLQNSASYSLLTFQ